MKIKLPLYSFLKVEGYPGGGILTVDTLQEVIIKVYANMGSSMDSRFFPIRHGLCEHLSMATSGRCWNCIHAGEGMVCRAPDEITHGQGIKSEEGVIFACRFWKERPEH